MPPSSAPDPFAKTMMGDPNAVAAIAEARKADTRPPTAPLVQIGSVAPARPNPVSPMASSMMSNPSDRPSAIPGRASGTPWNVPPAPQQPQQPAPPPQQQPVAPPPAAVAGRPMAPMAPGTMVLVYWSNGNRYPGTVLRAAGTQVLVAFPNGQQHWVDMQYVSIGG
jgi:hypothetical protein